MKTAIMQPYFFPYIGYFQLINSVDEFIIYDNIEYTKRGWVNRNQVLSKGESKKITLPIKKASDYLHIFDRSLADSWRKDRKKLLNQIRSLYLRAPFFKKTYNLVEECLMYGDDNLFNFLLNSIKRVKEHLNIETPIIISSDLDVDHSLKGQDKVLSICENRSTTIYINAIGGINLYSEKDFKNKNIALSFIKSSPISYKQFEEDHLPWLSIIDVMMFNSEETIDKYLNSYSLI
jgi:hypothetical protein